MAQHTLTFSEKNKGWTNFWPYVPDWMVRLNNEFFTIKNGQLYLHNDTSNSVRGNFYGTQHGFNVKTVFSDAMAEDKVFKTMALESEQKWDVEAQTNLTESTIDASEFTTRESRQFAYMRRNEQTDDYHGRTQGIGAIQSVDGLEITFGSTPEFVNIGDQLLQLNGEAIEVIGTITLVEGNVVTVASITTAPEVGYYAFAAKNARAEGGDMRGRYLEVILNNNEATEGELFAVTTEVSKSYV